MAKAKIKGVDCEVRVVRDLGDSYALQVFTPLPKTGRRHALSLRPFDEPPAGLVIKVLADDAQAALKTGLELLKKSGKIDDFVI